MLYLFNAVSILKEFGIGSTQEFTESKRVHLEHINLADWHLHVFLFDRYSEQATSCNNVIIWSILAEILQAVQGFFTLLNLVKDDKRLLRQKWNV